MLNEFFGGIAELEIMEQGMQLIPLVFCGAKQWIAELEIMEQGMQQFEIMEQGMQQFCRNVEFFDASRLQSLKSWNKECNQYQRALVTVQVPKLQSLKSWNKECNNYIPHFPPLSFLLQSLKSWNKECNLASH